MIRTRKGLGILVARFIEHLTLLPALAVALTVNAQPGVAQSACDFHRMLLVSASDPVTLDARLSQGELQIACGRPDQVSIAATARVPADVVADEKFLANMLAVEQDGNHVRMRLQSSTGSGEERIRIVCRIDVPYRTEVLSFVDDGRQTITGIMGPVKAETKKGDIKVSYVSRGVLATADSGNLDLEVIGERVEAKTRDGNILCIRVAEGASVETEDGDIVLMVVGPSKANVKKGNGRIDVGGARGSFVGSTAAGDLHVKAMPHDDWHLSALSGNIRVELPPAAKFEVDATTNFGEVVNDRDDIVSTNGEAHYLHRKVNGGGKHIEMHTDSGRIVIR